MTARSDPLTEYFSNMLLDLHFVDITPLKLGPTRRNDHSGVVGIGKQLGRFLIVEQLGPWLRQHRVWTKPSDIFDHYPIYLDWVDVGKWPPAPFILNHSWLKEVDFVVFIK